MINYRSNSDIVQFYNNWMKTTSGPKFSFNWGKFRFPKEIVPHEMTTLNSPAVVKLSGMSDDDWYEKIYRVIREMQDSGKLTNLNQIAFLFRSVTYPKVQGLADYLEENGIHVYAPRSNMFFKRDEVMFTIGCLLMLFPEYSENMEFIDSLKEIEDYYRMCLAVARKQLKEPGYEKLRIWITKAGNEHRKLKENTDYAYSGLIYRLFEYKPFIDMLDVDMNSGVNDVRPARNLATLSQMISKYEYLYRIDVLSSSERDGIRKIDRDTNRLFNRYLRLLIKEGLPEYEDDSEYAPSGCVSFMTIHQSKGLEFPIVFVDSLYTTPREEPNGKLMRDIEEKYYQRDVFEPYSQMKFFDFWRICYTAFSRAQDLLILTCPEDKSTPRAYFKGPYNALMSYDSMVFDLSEFSFHDVKNVNLKNTFSFTSHISVYDTCSLQYKFYKELGFKAIRASAMLFGTLVHETIEDVHKAAMRHEEHMITKENVEGWFNTNYESLSKAENAYLDFPQRQAALNQVLRYVARQNGDWSLIQQAEVDVSLVKPKYIIEGKIDLIRGKGDTVEIVDFKSQQKPDPNTHKEQLERYRRQLHIYSYLVEKRTGKKVSNMHLYYTAEENGDPKITFPYNKEAVDQTMSIFDDTVDKIMRKDFSTRCTNKKICQDCDFRHYCKSKEPYV